MNTSKFKLVFNGQIDSHINLSAIAPKFSQILDIPVELIGTYFSGQRVTLLDNAEFKTAKAAQASLEAIGIIADIKPTAVIDLESSQQLSAKKIQELTTGFSYRSTFKSKNDSSNPNKDIDELNALADASKAKKLKEETEMLVDAGGYKDPEPKSKREEEEVTGDVKWQG